MNADDIFRIVKASGVQSGELVLVHFWGENDEKPIAEAFVAAVAALGASPVLLQQSRSVNQALFSGAAEGCFDARYFERLSHFDAVLDVFAYQPIVLGARLPDAQMQRYRDYIAQLFGVLMKAKRFAQLRMPTPENAAESGLAPSEYMERMERAYRIDYAALRAKCEKEAARLKAHNRLVLRTGSDCALYVDVTGRAWHIDAGDGDWPCGEIYIAPREEATHGTVYFERLYLEEEGAFDGVTLRVEGGRAVDSDCTAVNEFLKRQPAENTVVCELGLGMNPNVQDACGYALLDEKRAGAFHIALGANTMFGGENEARAHMDWAGGAFVLEPEEA